MELLAVEGIGEIEAGDDLAGLLVDRADWADRTGPAIGADDIVCVASTIVSKTEGREADLTDFPAGPRATEIAARLEEETGDEKDPRFAQAVLEESTEVLIEAPFLLTETRFGHVTVNAGIDRSNIPAKDLLRLPKQPAESAARIRAALPGKPPVIVTDTSGRPFRHGQRGVAIGWAGMAASRDWRGERDRDGRELGVTVQCVVDELAGAANLLMGEGKNGTPAVIVHDFEFGDLAGSEAVFRAVETDYVRQALRGWSL
ncbi:coenzyme F420-0:L-glutamate ligase [Halobacteriales archaeon QS_8_65_32]|nr:MAG: coenzyme F420-0:L-glutamate ligase [Halobacteriales archaeon QS_8_65_32]